MAKKCLISVEGGLGKNVMLTALIPELKKKYEEIYVISPYHDVFMSCPDVDGAFPFGQGSLYQELVLDPDCDVLWKEPYSNGKFIKKQVHLFDAWAQEFGIKLTKPAMDYTPNLDGIAEEFPALKQAADKIAQESGKFILVQFCGGQSPLGPQQDAQGNPIPYNDRQEVIKRNYYKGQKLINLLQEKYPDAKIIHYALPNEPSYEGAQKVQVPYLTFRLLAEKAFKVVCTDSSLQHLATGACDDVTVIWGETQPEHFGYNSNHNLKPKKVYNSQPYFKAMGNSPAIVKFPTPEEIVTEVTSHDGPVEPAEK